MKTKNRFSLMLIIIILADLLLLFSILFSPLKINVKIMEMHHGQIVYSKDTTLSGLVTYFGYKTNYKPLLLPLSLFLLQLISSFWFILFMVRKNTRGIKLSSFILMVLLLINGLLFASFPKLFCLLTNTEYHTETPFPTVPVPNMNDYIFSDLVDGSRPVFKTYFYKQSSDFGIVISCFYLFLFFLFSTLVFKVFYSENENIEVNI